MFTTYGILDPRSKRFVYIGQTNNYERRKDEHLMAHRLRGRPKKGSLQYWLRGLNRAGLKPEIVALEVVETESQSLASELDWVKKLSAAGVPLLNRWEEHLEFISDAPEEGALPDLVPLLFVEKKAQRIGSVKLNRKKTGYTLTLAKGVRLDDTYPVELLPPTKNDNV